MSKILQEAIEAITWLDLDTAPKDGTIVKLKVLPGSGDDDACTSFEDSNDPYITIGFNQFCDTTVDEWDFAGWDWCHDCFTKGCGQVLAWAPFNSAADAARAQGAEVEPVAFQRQETDGQWANDFSKDPDMQEYWRSWQFRSRKLYAAPQPTDREKVLDAFEKAYPELFWHVGRGKVSAGEPLYGAIIATASGTEIGHGESDLGLDDAFKIAIRNAGLEWPVIAGGEA